MESVCPYCYGSGLFRHERPDVSDAFWLKMTREGTGICSLCRGKGKLDRPVDSLMIDSGLMFCRTSAGLTLVACPAASCVKWIDCTEFFNVRPKDAFRGKCVDGHEMTIDLVPTGRKP